MGCASCLNEMMHDYLCFVPSALYESVHGAVQACGVNLPVAYVLDHSHSLAAITQHVKELVRCAVAGACSGSFGAACLGMQSCTSHNGPLVRLHACVIDAQRMQISGQSCSSSTVKVQAAELTYLRSCCSGEGASGISFESIHGKDTHTIKAADLKLDRFLSDADRKAAAEAGEQLPAEPKVVLLTGANGFLGRFLLLDLLQRVASKCAPLPCDHLTLLVTLAPSGRQDTAWVPPLHGTQSTRLGSCCFWLLTSFSFCLGNRSALPWGQICMHASPELPTLRGKRFATH